MKLKLLSSFFLLLSTTALAGPAPAFSGDWFIDLRSPEEIKEGVECGAAGLDLKQSGKSITGVHYYATPRCGRIEESGPVSGSAKGNEATLDITSTRNGAIVRGKARIRGGKLLWEMIEIVKEGQPAGDELILQKAELRRYKSQ